MITFPLAQHQDPCLEHRDLQMTHVLFVSEMSHRIEHDRNSRNSINWFKKIPKKQKESNSLKDY